MLIVDQDGHAASALAEILASDGHQVELAIDLDSAPQASWDVVVVDAGGEPPAAIVDRIRPPGVATAPEVIVLGAHHDVDAAVTALHRGASDFLVKPVPPARLRLALGRALERRRLLRENARLRQDLTLLAAAQRLLEVLDPEELVRSGAEALCSTANAAGVHIWGPDIRGGLGLNEEERRRIEAQGPPRGYVEHHTGSALALPRFGVLLMLDLGDDVSACCAFEDAPGPIEQEGALFLARQLSTAFFNAARLRDAADQAMRDPLTGLWNATAFSAAADKLLDPDGAPFSLLFVDIDHFKAVNDRFGHLVGSRALVDIGGAVFGCVREGDMVGRYGGDELVVLLPGTQRDAAAVVAERIRAAVEALRFSGVPDLAVTVCVGVASYPVDGEDLRAVIDAADRAMYIGKRATRNQVRLAHPVVVPLTQGALKRP